MAYDCLRPVSLSEAARSGAGLPGAAGFHGRCAGAATTGISASTAYYTCAILLPKALVDQGGAVALSFGLASLLFMASIPGKLFTGYLMEVIGRRWTMTYSLAGSLPGIGLMAAAHWAGSLTSVVFIAGGLITGFTILSAFLARGSICPSNSPPNCVAAGTSSANQPRG